MSPKSRQPIEDNEPDDVDQDGLPDLPPSFVRVTRSREPKPVKAKLPVWWGIGGFVVLIAATLVVILLVSKPADPRTSADGTVKLVTDMLTRHDTTALVDLVCADDPALYPDDVDLYGTFGGASVEATRDEGPGLWSASLRSTERKDLALIVYVSVHDDIWCLHGITVCPVFLTVNDNAPQGCTDRPRP